MENASTIQKRNRGTRALILPSAAMLLFISIIPLCLLILFSFVDGNVTVGRGIDGFTIQNFVRAFSTPMVPRLMGKSFLISLIVTLICIGIGYPAAWAIAKVVKPQRRNMLVMMAAVPALISQLLLIYTIMKLLQPGSVLMAPLARIGLVGGSDTILYSSKAVIFILVYEYLPYMILCLYSVLEKIDDRVLEAARTLGAGNYRIFRDIILPQSFPGLFSGILIIFIPAAGSFVEPDIAGGPYGMMVGSLINTQYNTTLNMGYGAALSLILLVLMALALLVINFIMTTSERKIGGKINA